jgi:tetratricopeptide (TPR) repeat protein/CHAT domain-containing protein
MRTFATLRVGFLICLTLPAAAIHAQSSEWNNLNVRATALYERGHPKEAIPLLEQALGVAEKTWGPAHPNVGLSLEILAGAYRDAGRFSDAEPLFQRAIKIQAKAGNPQIVGTLVSYASLCKERGQFPEAEFLLKHALEISEKVGGPNHPGNVSVLTGLGDLYEARGNSALAEPLYKRALAITEKAHGPDDPASVKTLNSLANLKEDEGRYDEAETLLKQAMSIAAKTRDDLDAGLSLHNLALLYHVQGRDAEAEPLAKRALTTQEQLFGSEQPHFAMELELLALIYQQQGRYAEAEPLLKRALATEERVFGSDKPGVAATLHNLGGLYYDQWKFKEAEAVLERASAIDEKALGPEHPRVAQGFDALGEVYKAQARYAEAEAAFKHSLALREKVLTADHPGIATSLNYLAQLYLEEGRYSQAEPLALRAYKIAEKTLGSDRPRTLLYQANLGSIYNRETKFQDATTQLRTACAKILARRSSADLSGDTIRTPQTESKYCWLQLSLALFGWASQGGGRPNDRPDALQMEAFAAAQRAIQSKAGNAVAHSAAFAAARTSSAETDAVAYEAALMERDRLDGRYAATASLAGQDGNDQRATINKAYTEVTARIEGLAKELSSRAPQYWNYRSPQPLSTASLQARSGADALLLHENEALVVFLIPQGKENGLVFAISKEKFAWAQLPLTGTEFLGRIIKLRLQLDINSFGTGDASPRSQGPFDRRASYELYRALLGDDAIQGVIKDKPLLLFVSSQFLTGLPLGILVTAPPSGPDSDQSSLRKTAWLLRSKAVALIPEVSTLRTLRQIQPAIASTPDPLLVFADPDFTHPSKTTPTTVGDSGQPRRFSGRLRAGVPLPEALEDLPPLPGTRIEGLALERALHGEPGSLLTGKTASKAELMARNADGRLAKVRVLEFATHGLVAGDASDLAEPALALAAGDKPEDELLLASEAATLKLNADWVLLSACNTASPDHPGDQGLSGLSSAFLYAGAKSLLVSHWPVRDDIPPRLIPAMLLAERSNPTLTRAEALRRAALSILDDRTLNAADPSAWAPFSLIGEASR